MLKVITAAWVMPISRPPLENACVIINEDRIEAICQQDHLEQVLAGKPHSQNDYGEAVVLPGFINLHTHLEHTKLRKLASKETEFLEWLPKLMESTANWSVDQRQESAREGIKESIVAGTTLVVDFSYNGASLIPLAQSGLRAIVGLEIFGVDKTAIDTVWAAWLEKYQALLRNDAVRDAIENRRLIVTVAPHAPYTVLPALWERAKEWSKEQGFTLLTHLCESKNEYNWFCSDDGSLKDFLIYAFSKRMPLFKQHYNELMSWKSITKTSVEHLDKYGLLTDNTLAAHCVQVTDNDINLLKNRGVAVAHCPQSNAILKCGRAPLEKLLLSGVEVGLGTDSAASSNNLDMLAEAAYALKLHRQNGEFIRTENAFELITLKAARCIGLEDKVGSLDPGKFADLAIYQLPENGNKADKNAVYDLLLAGKCKLLESLVSGQAIFSERIAI